MLAIVAATLATEVAAMADEGAEGAPAPVSEPFVPGDIAIGEPIPLPFRGSGEGAPAADTAPDPAAPVTPPAEPPVASPAPPVSTPPVADRPAPRADAAAVPGSGWLGLSIAESNVPGRWRIDAVTADGPAARGGIAPGDELRAVNGAAIASADDLAQALTSIAAGDDVRLAVARTDQVRDIVVRAEPRPPASTSARQPRPPDWQAATPPRSAPASPPAAPTTPGSAFAAAPALAPPATEVPGPLPQPVVPSPAATVGDASGRGRTALGVRTMPVDAVTQARFHLPEPAGAYVFGVVQDLPASRAGIPPGSVIVALGDRPVRSPLELTRLVTSGPVDRPVTLDFILPGGEAKRTEVVLQALEAPLEQVLVGGVVPAAGVPTLEPSPVPRRAERPVADEVSALRAEIARLRQTLERLETRLDERPPATR